MDASGAQNIKSITFRSSGLWGGFDSASVFLGLGIVYLSFFNEVKVFYRVFGIILSIVAMLLTGARVGFVALIASAFIFISIYDIKKIPVLILGLLILPVISYFIIISFAPVEFVDSIELTVNRQLELFQSGGTTTSTDVLMTMFYLPG